MPPSMKKWLILKPLYTVLYFPKKLLSVMNIYLQFSPYRGKNIVAVFGFLFHHQWIKGLTVLWCSLAYFKYERTERSSEISYGGRKKRQKGIYSVQPFMAQCGVICPLVNYKTFSKKGKWQDMQTQAWHSDLKLKRQPLLWPLETSNSCVHLR